MKTNVDAIVDVPCFKCLFWDNLKQSHLYCRPNECEKLDGWLIEQAEGKKEVEGTIMVVTPKQARARATMRNK
jgi:hypothetical protein